MGNEFNMNLGHVMLGRCKYGWMFFNGPIIGKCFELYGEYSESEVSVFKHFLNPGSVVIEVGANIGSLTIPIASLVGDSGRVFAFESQPETFNLLCANLAMNQIKNVRPINMFVANDSNVETASPAWGEYAFVSDVWETQFTKIDSLNIFQLDFIKIDVDGNELTVLQSGEELINIYRPILYFENDVREKSSELLKWVMEHDYRIFAHAAPVCSTENFYGNPENFWHPNRMISLMILAIPGGNPVPTDIPEIKNPDEWWDNWVGSFVNEQSSADSQNPS